MLIEIVCEGEKDKSQIKGGLIIVNCGDGVWKVVKKVSNRKF